MDRLILDLFVYPVLEEYVFRLHVMGWLARQRPDWSPLAVNFATSLVFSACHMLVWPWEHAMSVMVPSLMLGILMQRTKRWILCAVMHGAMNGFWLFFMHDRFMVS